MHPIPCLSIRPRPAPPADRPRVSPCWRPQGLCWTSPCRASRAGSAGRTRPVPRTRPTPRRTPTTRQGCHRSPAATQRPPAHRLPPDRRDTHHHRSSHKRDLGRSPARVYACVTCARVLRRVEVRRLAGRQGGDPPAVGGRLIGSNDGVRRLRPRIRRRGCGEPADAGCIRDRLVYALGQWAAGSTGSGVHPRLPSSGRAAPGRRGRYRPRMRRSRAHRRTRSASKPSHPGYPPCAHRTTTDRGAGRGIVAA